MYLQFEAQEVHYSEALGGDLVQVHFQEHSDPDIDYSKKNQIPPPIKGVTISANYEFPPYDSLVEWCDGEDYNGGLKIKKIELTKTSLTLVLENQFNINVSFKTDDITFKKIQIFLLDNNK